MPPRLAVVGGLPVIYLGHVGAVDVNGTELDNDSVAGFQARAALGQQFAYSWPICFVLAFLTAVFNLSYMIAVISHKRLQFLCNYMLMGQSFFDLCFGLMIAIWNAPQMVRFPFLSLILCMLFLISLQSWQVIKHLNGGLVSCHWFGFGLFFVLSGSVVHLAVIAEVRRRTVMLPMDQTDTFTLRKYLVVFGCVFTFAMCFALLPMPFIGVGKYVLQPSGHSLRALGLMLIIVQALTATLTSRTLAPRPWWPCSLFWHRFRCRRPICAFTSQSFVLLLCFCICTQRFCPFCRYVIFVRDQLFARGAVLERHLARETLLAKKMMLVVAWFVICYSFGASQVLITAAGVDKPAVPPDAGINASRIVVSNRQRR